MCFGFRELGTHVVSLRWKVSVEAVSWFLVLERNQDIPSNGRKLQARKYRQARRDGQLVAAVMTEDPNHCEGSVSLPGL